jgi:hypothetical protein
MGKLTRKLIARGKAAAEKAYEKVETRILVAEGRKAVRGKARSAARVSRKAAKAGLIAGAMTAAGVVVREIRKRRNRD